MQKLGKVTLQEARNYKWKNSSMVANPNVNDKKLRLFQTKHNLYSGY